jgi:hypothetical protein
MLTGAGRLEARSRAELWLCRQRSQFSISYAQNKAARERSQQEVYMANPQGSSPRASAKTDFDAIIIGPSNRKGTWKRAH